jgi:protein-disulfide isomerase
MPQNIKKPEAKNSAPQTATPNSEINNPQIKFFLYSSTGLIVLAALFFILSSVWLIFKPSDNVIDKTLTQNQNQTEPIAKKGNSPDLLVTKAPERQKITYPSITFIDPQLGSPDAPITIIEFSDFNCPYCAQVQETLAALFIKYPNQIRLVWKSLPITQLHPSAKIAAQAALCAGEQDKFWEYHDLLFANQDYFSGDALVSFAKELNLKTSSFSSCLESGKMAPRVEKTLQEAEDLLISSTPHFYINQQEITGAADLEDFVKIIEIELNK